MMNERIKLLEAQCWEPRQYGPAWFDSTKFAELIVQECAEQVKNLRVNDYGISGAEIIREHFGIE
tara:strand:- start:132 stop:326 length:195 start_codon:yes stop_codon:yes gene_type:complete